MHFLVMSTVIGEGRVLFHRVYAGPEYWAGLCTLVGILAAAALFNVFTAPFFFPVDGTLAALVVVWLATIFCVIANFRLVFMDPGIVPRGTYFRDQSDPVKNIQRERPPMMAVEQQVRGFPVRTKFCDTCNIYRAPRVTHCSSCDTCIERFDHHCPWLGNCVGKRNYPTFLVFMFSLSIMTLGIIGISIAQLALASLDEAETSDMGPAIRNALTNNIAVAIVTGIAILFMWFIVGLTGYHCFLSFHAMTTYEHIRGAFDTLGNPYDDGRWYRNFFAIFTTPTRPSWIDLKTKSTAEVVKLDSVLESN
jgi:hypothetical protein